MALNTVWVYAEIAEGKPLTLTLELLTKAREPGRRRGRRRLRGANASEIAPRPRRVRGGQGVRHRRSRRASARAGRGRRDRRVDRGRQRARPHPVRHRPTTAATSPAAFRRSSTAPCSRTASTSSSRATPCASRPPIFGGNTLVTTEFTGARSGHRVVPTEVVRGRGRRRGGAAEVVALAVPDTGATGAGAGHRPPRGGATGPKLDEADVVVSGGRGLGEAGKYEMIEQLAKLLRARRARRGRSSTPAGCPTAYQVGQTGKVVKPTVYIACGISGATQHMVGMKGAKNIIAINKDKEAPIFGDRRSRHRRRRAQGAPEADRGAREPRLSPWWSGAPILGASMATCIGRTGQATRLRPLSPSTTRPPRTNSSPS